METIADNGPRPNAVRNAELEKLLRGRIEVAEAAREIAGQARKVLAAVLGDHAIYLASSNGLTDAQMREVVGSMRGAWLFAAELDTAIAASENSRL